MRPKLKKHKITILKLKNIFTVIILKKKLAGAIYIYCGKETTKLL